MCVYVCVYICMYIYERFEVIKDEFRCGLKIYIYIYIYIYIQSDQGRIAPRPRELKKKSPYARAMEM